MCLQWSLNALSATLLISFLAATAFPPIVLADGDPASDVLASEPIFLSADAPATAAERAALDQLLRALRAHGLPVKVAVIGSQYDLGSVAVLWRQPDRYVRFLGVELSLLYRGRLLVVMPNGIGVSRAGKSSPADTSAVASAHPQAGLLPATLTALQLLAQAHRITLPAPSTSPPTTAAQPHAHPWLTASAVALGLLLAAAGWVFSLHVRPLRPNTPLQDDE